MTATDDDPVRAFRAALTPAARNHLDMSPNAVALIRAAGEKVPPLELARICSAGIGWNHPANAHALMLFRLQREAHIDQEASE